MSIRRLAIPLFLCGMVIGWLLSSYVHTRSKNEAILMLNVRHLSEFDRRAKDAYKYQSPEVAIWETRHFVERLEQQLHSNRTPKSTRLQLFLGHARLAKLLLEIGREGDAKESFEIATKHYYIDHPNAPIEDLNALLQRLDEFDKRTGVIRHFRSGKPGDSSESRHGR